MATLSNQLKPTDETVETLADNAAQPARQSHQSNGLPSPIEFPKSDVAIYDGACVFCTRQVTNLMKWDGKHRISYISLHDQFVAEHFSDLSHEQMMEQMYVVPNLAPSGSGFSTQRFGGAAALRYLTRRLPKLWIFAPLLHIPYSLPLWQWAYNQVAKRRYKIAGRTDPCDENGACELHFKDK